MFERNLLKELIAWAHSDDHKPLIIRGARQVGKSTIVEMLANQAHLACVTLNFERNPELAELFQSKTPTDIIGLVALATRQPIIPGQTLLFLDEIQAAPEVFATLRYFYEEMPKLHIIAAGSLLEFSLRELAFSMPVGRIEYYYLGPMLFDEFLLALDEKILVEFLQSFSLGDAFPLVIHEQLMHLLKLYLIIGGMPASVQAYVSQRDFMQVERVKRSILETYQDDFSKYTLGKQAIVLRDVFKAIPRLMTQQIKYSEIDAHRKSTVISDALDRLSDAKMISYVYHSAANGVPLGAQCNQKIFKLIFIDGGLLASQLGLSYLDLNNIAEMNLVNSGMMSEQFIGQHLLYMHPCFQPPELYFWKREKPSSMAEVDFVISHRQMIIPIEVKAGKTGQLKSMWVFMDEKDTFMGVKFSSQLPSLHADEEGRRIISLPLYMVQQLPRLLTDNA